MYTYKVETLYDSRIPQTWLAGFAPRGLAEHWTAGGTGRQGALDTRTFFINTAAQRNASYHILVYWDPVARIFGVMWIVDPRAAAHSLAPQPVSAGGSYNPNAEVRRILGAKVNDPNAGCLAISFCGMPADLEVALRDPDFVAGYRRLHKDLSVIPSLVDRPLFNHGWAQPTTRYDAGDKLIPLIYGETPTQGVDDMQYWKPVQEDWTTLAGARFWDGNGEAKTFAGGHRVTTIAESSDGTYRLGKWGNELLVMERAGLKNIPGTRVPASPNYGFPPPPEPETVTVVKEVPTGITEVQLGEKYDEGVLDEKARLRKFLGLL